MSDSTIDLYKLGIQGPQPERETNMANAMLPECSHCDKPFGHQEQGAFMSSHWPSTAFNVRHGCGAEFNVVQLPGIGRPGLSLTNDPPAANVIDAESEEGETEESTEESTEEKSDGLSGSEGTTSDLTDGEKGDDGNESKDADPSTDGSDSGTGGGEGSGQA